MWHDALYLLRSARCDRNSVLPSTEMSSEVAVLNGSEFEGFSRSADNVITATKRVAKFPDGSVLTQFDFRDSNGVKTAGGSVDRTFDNWVQLPSGEVAATCMVETIIATGAVKTWTDFHSVVVGHHRMASRLVEMRPCGTKLEYDDFKEFGDGQCQAKAFVVTLTVSCLPAPCPPSPKLGNVTASSQPTGNVGCSSPTPGAGPNS